MDAPDISLRAADLLAGPRGRRLLLEFGCDVADNALGSAVHEVSADLDPQRDRIARYVRYTDEPGDTAGASAPATPDTVARLLTVAAGRIPLPDPADRWTVAWGEDAAPCPAMTAEKRISNLLAWCTRTRESEQRDSGFLALPR